MLRLTTFGEDARTIAWFPTHPCALWVHLPAVPLIPSIATPVREEWLGPLYPISWDLKGGWFEKNKYLHITNLKFQKSSCEVLPASSRKGSTGIARGCSEEDTHQIETISSTLELRAQAFWDATPTALSEIHLVICWLSLALFLTRTSASKSAASPIASLDSGLNLLCFLLASLEPFVALRNKQLFVEVGMNFLFVEVGILCILLIL